MSRLALLSRSLRPRSRAALGLAGALLLGACGLLVDSNSIKYPMELDPQEFKHDFSEDFNKQPGNFPTVDCSKDATMCSKIPNLPSGVMPSCEAGKCVASYDVRLPVTVNLSQQTSFPSAVKSSPVIDDVQVDAVHFWTASNSLTFDLPPIDLYVGGQTAMKETDPGVSKLGTLDSIKRMPFKTACRAGTPGTKETACDMALTEAGRKALATLAREFKAPFNVLLVAHLTVRAGEPYPSGALDLFLQPVIAFVLPLN